MTLRRPSAGLYYVFCDEKYFNHDDALSIGVILVPQQNWSNLNADVQSLRAPKEITRIERLKNVLDRVDGIGLIGWAKTSEIMEPGHRDSTADITGMARTDNIWGFAMATSVYRTLISARVIKLEVCTADIYYDTFDLRADHLKALHAALQNQIPADIRQAREGGCAPSDFRPMIRRIKDTPKPVRGSIPTKFQTGVMLAHTLLQRTIQLRTDSSAGRISTVDNTSIVNHFINQFK